VDIEFKIDMLKIGTTKTKLELSLSDTGESAEQEAIEAATARIQRLFAGTRAMMPQSENPNEA
jgi:hypothetical protein